MARVFGPGQGTWRSSTEFTELISAAVPQTKISSAMYRSLRAMLSTRQSMPRSAAIVITELWVIPSSAPADSGGVSTTPLRETKMFSPVHSATSPFGASMIASS